MTNIMNGVVFVFSIIATIIIYWVMKKVQTKTQNDLLNPLLLSSVIIIVILILFKIPYETYNSGAQWISKLIGPATVALAIPLYQHIGLLKKHWRTILIAVVSGIIAHTITIVTLALILKLKLPLIASIIPKSVTTAIAADISKSLGGINAITVCIVIITGIFGAAIAPLLNRLFKINDPFAQGLALGSAAHAVGTAKAQEMGVTQGVMATLALIITGLLMIVSAPLTYNIIVSLL